MSDKQRDKARQQCFRMPSLYRASYVIGRLA